MRCPKCEEGTLMKIKFNATGKTAYLCDVCRTYWLTTEHIESQAGHILDENAQEFTMPETFSYLKEEDKEAEEVKDEKKREEYSHRHS